jgi:hypothetical protein
MNTWAKRETPALEDIIARIDQVSRLLDGNRQYLSEPDCQIGGADHGLHTAEDSVPSLLLIEKRRNGRAAPTAIGSPP